MTWGIVEYDGKWKPPARNTMSRTALNVIICVCVLCLADKNEGKLLLTDEDKNMLERWKNMQSNTPAPKKPATDTTAKPPTKGNPPQDDPAVSLPEVQNLDIQDKSSMVNTQGRLKMADPQTRVQGPQIAAQNEVLGTQLNLAPQEQLQAEPALQTRGQAQGFAGNGNETETANALPELSQNVPDSYGEFLQADCSLAQGSTLPSMALQDCGLPGPGYFTSAVTTSTADTATVAKWLQEDALQQKENFYGSKPEPVLPEIGPDYHIPTLTGPWPNLAPLAEPVMRLPTYDEAMQARRVPGAGGVTLLGTEDYSLLDNLNFPSVGAEAGSSTSQNPDASHPNAAQQQQQQQGEETSPALLDSITKLLMKSHMEDLTLAQTPKGTGGGYGVGLDLDSVIRDSASNLAPPQDGQVWNFIDWCTD